MATAIVNEPFTAGNPVLSVASLQPIVYRGHPVIPTSVLANLYETEEDYVRRNFNRNRSRFVEGKHFFFITGKELRDLKHSVSLSDAVDDSGSLRPAAKISPRVNTLTVWTSRGAARHAKMLDTDKAWDVFELLEENYFSRRPVVAEPVAPPSASPRLTTAKERNALAGLVNRYVGLLPGGPHQEAYKAAWRKVHDVMGIGAIEELTVEQLPRAVMFVQSMVEALAKPEAVPALPPVRTRNTLGDYKALYRELPGSPQYWMDLLSRYLHAHEILGSELEAIKAEATKPFRVGRKSDVSTYFDEAMSPAYSLFDNAEKALHLAYCQVFDAMDGFRSIWLLLNKG